MTRISRRLLTALATIALLLGLAGTMPAGAATPGAASAARADCSAQAAAAQQAEADLSKKFDKYTKAKHKFEVVKHIAALADTPQEEAKARRAVKKAEKKYKKALKKFQAAQAVNVAAQQAYDSCQAQP